MYIHTQISEVKCVLYIFPLYLAGVDYMEVEEDLQFESNEVVKVIQIPLAKDDVFPEANKTFEVYLSASQGVFISPIGYVSAVILNDDLPIAGTYMYMNMLMNLYIIFDPTIILYRKIWSIGTHSVIVPLKGMKCITFKLDLFISAVPQFLMLHLWHSYSINHMILATYISRYMHCN